MEMINRQLLYFRLYAKSFRALQLPEKCGPNFQPTYRPEEKMCKKRNSRRSCKPTGKTPEQKQFLNSTLPVHMYEIYAEGKSPLI
jgi:hypothetical protein